MIKLLLIKLRKLKRLLTIMEYIVDEWVAIFKTVLSVTKGKFDT